MGQWYGHWDQGDAKEGQRQRVPESESVIFGRVSISGGERLRTVLQLMAASLNSAFLLCRQ